MPRFVSLPNLGADAKTQLIRGLVQGTGSVIGTISRMSRNREEPLIPNFLFIA